MQRRYSSPKVSSRVFSSTWMLYIIEARISARAINVPSQVPRHIGKN
ncbi:MAG: hypothetical protein P4L50_14130 [Anaerolineaceae bacterium]|nr:hypothetical protein [Anaerolineaceae bacterium]